MKNAIPELKPEMITAIIDTREQYPLDLHPLKMLFTAARRRYREARGLIAQSEPADAI